MARFDRLIPPGGEGKITLMINLTGHRGKVTKSATVYCNDPQNPRVALALSVKVVPFIDVRPWDTVVFRGSAAQIKPQEVELESSKVPMQIVRVENGLEKEVRTRVETLANGKRYRVVLENLAEQGSYSGYVRVITDHPQKPEVLLSVRGMVEGPIGIRPTSLLVGKIKGNPEIRVGRVLVVHHGGAAFRITRLDYDAQLLEVTAKPQEGLTGYVLDVAAKLDTVALGTQKRTPLKIETDIRPEDRLEVQIFVVHQ
ncbi:hypothetical protein EDC27_2357 [Desulfosoma caldarium]|uniref:DUF1573 domain-containing protein n=2 Tax=Desulfosoma caldarium TaxID=610254 RepID=A0A3N1UQV7_9BACT|nr:hypothetical protein EDC27_2357 [Desulfosoma caldarium]